jgi:hypothetical protein
MERQTGLGRSLEDVLHSLTPVDSAAPGAGRVLFEPGDLEQQLDQLMGDVAALRERVRHLVGLVPDRDQLPVDQQQQQQQQQKKKKKKKKKHAAGKGAKHHEEHDKKRAKKPKEQGGYDTTRG